jgi:hypothetical protein
MYSLIKPKTPFMSLKTYVFAVLLFMFAANVTQAQSTDSCYLDLKTKFKNAKLKPLLDGTHNIVIVIRSNNDTINYCQCIEARAKIDKGELVRPVLIKQKDGSYAKLDPEFVKANGYQIDDETYKKYGILYDLKIKNGMSDDILTNGHYLITIFVVDLL